jgi:DNA-binding NtrC family response regulator
VGVPSVRIATLLKETTKTLRIAVVDDEPDLTSTYSRVIRALGYGEPSIFHDGTSLIRALMAHRDQFDVILMDYRMPEMNVIEAAKIIMRYRKGLKIVITSGYGFVIEKARDMGLPFLQKPFSMEQLEECLDSIKGEEVPKREA